MDKDYLSFWGINSNVFNDLTSPEHFFIPSSWSQEYQRHRYFCQQANGLLLVEGGTGSGKTILGTHIYDSFSTSDFEVLYFNLSNSKKKSGWLLKRVAQFFNTKLSPVNTEQYSKELLIGLEELELEKKKLVIYLDNADLLDKPAYFDDIKALLDTNKLLPSMTSVTLASTTGSSAFIKKCLGSYQIEYSFNLTPWSISDCTAFIKSRLELTGLPSNTFRDDSISFIHETSKGCAGKISSLSERALLEAFIQKSKIIDHSTAILAANQLEPLKKTQSTSKKDATTAQSDKKSISFEQLVEKDVI